MNQLTKEAIRALDQAERNKHRLHRYAWRYRQAFGRWPQGYQSPLAEPPCFAEDLVAPQPPTAEILVHPALLKHNGQRLRSRFKRVPPPEAA